MRVWVLISYTRYKDDSRVKGVFRSREEAEQYLKIGTCFSEADEHGVYHNLYTFPTGSNMPDECAGWDDHVEIEEHELDQFKH